MPVQAPRPDSAPAPRILPAAPPPQVGDNSYTKEDLLFLNGQLDKAIEKKKEAQALVKKVRQAMALKQIPVHILDEARHLATLEPENLLDHERQRKRLLEILCAEAGTQFVLDFNTPKRATEDTLAKAARTGYQRGVGGDFPDEEAYPPLTEEGKAHREAWERGQKINLDKLKDLNAMEAPKRGRPAKPQKLSADETLAKVQAQAEKKAKGKKKNGK